MKKNILSSIFTLIIACLSLVIQSQDITLNQSSKSGIYRKGQKITVKALAENLAGDTLHIKVFKNNNQLINQKSVIIGKDSLIVMKRPQGNQVPLLSKRRPEKKMQV